jgi:drug/metabolite transporter (DMT)-like permease
VAVIGGQEAAGFGIAVLAAGCYDGGYALQALEARRAPHELALRPALFGYLLRRPLWVAATAISLVGWPLQILALTLAPLTLVQPALALGLLLLLLLGVVILHEPVGRREIAGVLIIIAAVALIAWAAPDDTGTVPRDAGLVVALSLLAAVAILPYLPLLRRQGVWLLVAGAGAADGLAAFVAKLVAEDASAGRWLAVAALAALAGAVVVMGVTSESTALQRAAATRVAPAVLAMQIAIPVVLAPLVGGESWASTPLGGWVLVMGLVLVATGVALVASSPAVASLIAESREGPEAELPREPA